MNDISNLVPRSIFVTVLAWVSIVLSGFMVFIGILQNIMIFFFFPFPNEEFDDAFAEAKKQADITGSEADIIGFGDFMFHNFQFFFMGVLAFSIFVLVSSIGLLKRKNWARISFIVIMVVTVIWNVVGVGFSFMFTSMVPTIPESPEAEEFQNMMTAMMIGNLMMFAIISGICIWIIRKLLSDKIRNEFT